MSIASSPTADRPEAVSQLRRIVDRSRPTVLAREQVLPVLPALCELLPGGALQRGTTVSVQGEAATSLALALLAGASAAGSWIAIVGLPSLGLAAAAELGLALERLVVVRDPSPASWGSVVAALVGSFDAVLLAPTHRVRPADSRRLAARAASAVRFSCNSKPAHGPGSSLMSVWSPAPCTGRAWVTATVAFMPVVCRSRRAVAGAPPALVDSTCGWPTNRAVSSWPSRPRPRPRSRPSYPHETRRRSGRDSRCPCACWWSSVRTGR